MANDPLASSGGDSAKDRFMDAANERVSAAAPASSERSLWKGGYSGKAMYGTWAVTALLSIAGLVGMLLLGDRHNLIWPVGGAAIIALWVIVLGIYMVRRLSVHYELTSQRFIHQRGILVRRTDRIEVIDIDDVSFTQGIIQRMLGVGTIQITSSDRTHPELKLIGIDQVATVSNMIDDVRRDERRRRSLHIESV